MNSLREYIKNEFPILKLKGEEGKHILTIELCYKYYTDDKRYIGCCYNKALEIFEDIYEKDDDIILIMNVYEEKDNINKEPVRIRNYIKNKKLIKNLNCIATQDNEEYNLEKDERILHYYLNCKVKDIDYKNLILHLCGHEVGFDVKSMGHYFIINKIKKICYIMLDDRCLDLAFKNNIEKKKYKRKYTNRKNKYL